MDKTFRQLVLDVAREADLSMRERVKLRILLRVCPDRLATELFNQCQAEGRIPVGASIDDNVAAVDWEKFFSSLAELIKELLPIILQVLPFLL